MNSATTTTAKRFTYGGAAAIEVEVEGTLYRGTMGLDGEIFVEQMTPYIGHIGYVRPNR